MHITRPQAARFLLARHYLLPPRLLAGKEGILAFLARTGSIQFDPLDRVGTNPELVLQSRVHDFTAQQLTALLYHDRHLVEGFDKMMSIYLREDFPAFSREREAARERFGRDGAPVLQALPAVREEVQRRGPLCSSDLALEERVDWPWAPTKLGRAALESMFFWGELVIERREKRRKYYDFARRHLPLELLQAPDPFPTEEAYHRWRVKRRIGGIGLLPDRPGDAWIGIRGLKSRERSQALHALTAAGELAKVQLEESSRPWYLLHAELPLLESCVHAEAADGDAREAAFLAPLDNLIWDRGVTSELFDFDYRWEVYKPAAERRFGYYVLPVLYGERFVARFEPLRNSSGKGLFIRNWWWEEGIEPDSAMIAALRRAFTAFIRYLGGGNITLSPEASAKGLGEII